MGLRDWFKDLRQSFHYAWQGICYCFKAERNMRTHLAMALLAILFSFLLSIPKEQFLIIMLVNCFVLCLELVNTAIERAVDLITTEYHPLAKIAKDTAAGSVLLAALFAFIIGLFVFLPPLFSWLKWLLTHFN